MSTNNTKKVFIYWNIHKHCWSVRDYRTRKVIEHRQSLTLIDCTFKVSEAGRQRVLCEKRKNVHAGVIGYLSDDVQELSNGVVVYYNPYLQSTFTVHGSPIYNADIVTFYPDKKVLTLHPSQV